VSCITFTNILRPLIVILVLFAFDRNIFERVSTCSDDPAFSSRMRFMLKDLVDMRNNKWQGRREKDVAKKLSDLRNDGPPNGKSVANPPQDARAQIVEHDGWTTVAGSGNKKGVPMKVLAKEIPKTTQKTNQGGFGALASVKKTTKTIKRETKSDPTVSDSDGMGISPAPEDGGESQPEEKEDAEADSLPGADGPVDAETLRRLASVVEEYYMNGMLDEALQLFRELVHPRGMAEALKFLVVQSFEKKEVHRKKLALLLTYLFKNDFLCSETAAAGVSAFLDGFDELKFDVPLEGEYAATILGELLLEDIIPLSLLLDTFSQSLNAPELILRCIGEMCKTKEGGLKAKSVCEGITGLSDFLLTKLSCGSEEEAKVAVDVLVQKFSIPFQLTA
jgi:hypothetical protein